MVMTFLDPEAVPEGVWVAHLLERSGAIPHDHKLAKSYDNDLARRALREAEAFDAGYRAGLKHGARCEGGESDDD